MEAIVLSAAFCWLFRSASGALMLGGPTPSMSNWQEWSDIVRNGAEDGQI